MPDSETQTDPCITSTLTFHQIILLEQLERKWFKTLPVLNPLTKLREEMGLTTEDLSNQSYERELAPALGDRRKNAEEIDDAIYGSTPEEKKKRKKYE
jgi:hypothetical protein